VDVVAQGLLHFIEPWTIHDSAQKLYGVDKHILGAQAR